MNTRFLHRILLTLAVGLIGVAIATPVHAGVLPGQPEVYPRDSSVFGRTYSEWSAEWEQWAYSLPYDHHPLFDTAGCSTGQSGPVWFLGGKFCSPEVGNCSPTSAVRSCTVPTGTALYFPVVVAGCLGIEADNDLCFGVSPASITAMRAALAHEMDQTTNLQVIVDGKSVKGNLKTDFRVQSPVWTAVLPEDNLPQGNGETIPATPEGQTYWGVDDGVYVMLQPLPRGAHTLRFMGTFPQADFSLDITYNLTVQ
jgi:hypothetical protein